MTILFRSRFFCNNFLQKTLQG